MKKQINIEGMTCSHCVNRIAGTLEEISGVKVLHIDLKGKNAVVELSAEVPDSNLKDAVEDKGYQVVSIVELTN